MIYSFLRLRKILTAAHHAAHLHYAGVSCETCLHGLGGSAHTLVKGGLATSTTTWNSCDGGHIGRVCVCVCVVCIIIILSSKVQ
jgi:hypothetical protein